MDFDVILSDALRSGIGPIAAIYVIAAMGLNLHFGYTGLLNFGQVGFMLVGGYGLAITVVTWGGSMWLGVLVGLASAVVLALLLGLPTLRLRADYLAITTIAAGETLRLFYRSSWAEPTTGGVFGLQRFANDFYDLNPIPRGTYGFWTVEFSARDLWVMIVAWGLVVIVGVLLALLIHSPWGRVIRSIRDDETAVRSLGKNVYAYKMTSLVLGGVLGGVAGMLQAIQVQSVSADSFDPAVTFFLYTLLVLGGAGRILGPVVGSILFWFVLTFIDSALRQAIDAGYISSDLISTSEIGAVRFALVGLALILLMAFRPQGILGSRKEMLLSGR
ncbi:branched-chain amino acid ABC transporter permease [Streptomyces lunaelactis]|uniref:Branched-chain amino acid ABC transporter permease n=1 Tax=Streptomyces lunaelactis TaxID=1535768 RepID=A0A2R4TA70_9ACTN|nr:branched-chain amino acid ABC transporter permease [Streptomyces lunaelactis]AVZ75974.1 branched-chain amino acid ABC transporter permease [Streptomyces lunaelactis]NUJ99832.1 branched-chain amino acid ABC transporter permease [Streptomyces lunaelactis]NUK07775.1 branched-chain amino acid ABC transporter permease [Streptomyces lunaelactis]NUK13900.1 branched-chain amino acid ABC transporter permease [Streptomyces lunaelactis]NUK22217.1 branched-chain amino acid ABC transporter permease [Str